MRAAAALALLILSPAAARATPAAVRASPAKTYDFKVGSLRLTALNDGASTRPNDGRVLAPVPRVTALLRASGLPTDAFALQFSALLVRTTGHVILIDTGLGAGGRPDAGGLMDALAAAGVVPASVTDVVISHPHFDHIGGLLTATRAPAFPNARIHISPADWAKLKPESTPPMLAAIEPKLALIPASGAIAPGVRAVPIRGHTPGHTGVEVSDGGQRLLYVGDSMHHYLLSVAGADLDMQFDGDGPTAKASRQALVARAAAERLLIYAPHFPFPGLGHIRRDGEGYAFEPVAGSR